MPDREWWAALWADPEAVLRAMGVHKDMLAVDLCCGDGYFTVPLARITRRTVYGIDLDPYLVKLASAEADRTEVVPCVFIRGDARELTKLLPERVDYVFLANTFHGVDSKTGLAREIRAALRPNCRFGIVNWHQRPREKTVVLGKARGPQTGLRMTPEQTQEAIEPAGFALERLIDLPPYHYGAAFLNTVES